MNGYELNFIIPSPARSASFMEFSPDGRFLAVGDQGLSSLHILDKVTGFHPIIAGMLTGEPTALVWETSETFYAGLKNGVFIHYRIDQKANELVEGVVNVSLRDEGFPITAMALDVESKRMVISVGPGVFAFRRIRGTSGFRFVARISTRFKFRRDPGTPAPPFPRSICFAPNNVLVITFCRQYIVSIVLESDGYPQLQPLEMVNIDYSGLPILKLITSANEDEIHQLTRMWVHGHSSESGAGGLPFIFINGGAATLSGSPLGIAIIRDTITHRQIQLLEHTATTTRTISVIAYHVSNYTYNIATVDRGADATVKIWTARRSSSRSNIQRGFHIQKGWVVTTLVISFTLAVLIKAGILLDTNEFSRFCVQSALAFAKAYIKFGLLVLDVAGMGNALD